MRKWMPHSVSLSARSCRPRARFLSTAVRDVERVNIPCGSTGHVNIDLYNIGKLPSVNKLLLYLPPYSVTSPDEAFPPPPFSWEYPTAVINYRWSNFNPFRIHKPLPHKLSAARRYGNDPLGWPVPLNDVSRAYTWIIENLHGLASTRTDIFVYGSYLGATLAASLALTECQSTNPVAVRGCIAYNGIYDWTRCLPDHPFNKLKEPKWNQSQADYEKVEVTLPPTPSDDADFHLMEQYIETLFGDPQFVFDPFASPCLFFHQPGILVPPFFNVSATSTTSLSKIYPYLKTAALKQIAEKMERLRRSRIEYPPSSSPLVLPQMLLLYTEPPRLARSSKKHQKRAFERTLKGQAVRLAKLICISRSRSQRGNWEPREKDDEEEREAEWEEGQEDVQANIENDTVQLGRVSVNPEMGPLGGEDDELVSMWINNANTQYAWK